MHEALLLIGSESGKKFLNHHKVESVADLNEGPGPDLREKSGSDTRSDSKTLRLTSWGSFRLRLHL